MSEPAGFTRAKFIPKSGKGEEVTVHFNPVSLQYSVANTLQQQGQEKKQYVTKSTAKLTMDLVFDTTHDGQDVRTLTGKIARYMEPAKESPGSKQEVPAIVEFVWGAYVFQGMVESYKETLDFFSPEGVPLRASINLTLFRQEKVFEPSATAPRVDTQGALQPEPIQVPAGAGDDTTSLGARAGDPRAGRAIAAANGLASMRFAAGATLSVGGSVTLGPPVAFASGGAGLSLGGGLAAGAGGAASAGVAASAGAFAGLRVAARPAGTSLALDPSRLLPRSATAELATDQGATFDVGGQARNEGSASFKADVGASASLRSRLEFEES